MKKRKSLAAAALAVCLLAGCAPQTYQTDFFAMDTFMSISAFGDGAQERAGEAERTVNALENHISRTREQSEIYALNHADGQPVELSQDTYDLLAFAREMAEETGGSFDPTVAPLSDLWGIGTENAHIPAQTEIDAALASVGYENLVLSAPDAQPLTARLENGAQIDLGGVGKGYAADIAAACWDGMSGRTGAMLMLGGNIYAVGRNSKGQDWTVGIGDPEDSLIPVATLRVSGESVVTTGDYERYFEQNGVRYHHVFDPATGYPAQTDLRSVTVVGTQSARCDALSTALFVMGEARAWDYAQQNGIKAVFITGDRRMRVTDALRAQYTFAGEDAGYVDAS